MSESKYANLLAEAVANEADTLKKVSPKYAKVATELAVIFAGENAGAKIHAYCCAAQDSTANGDAWNRAVTGLGKALGKLPSPLKFSAKRDFRPTHRDKAPLFSLVLIADANTERKELARVAKEQADQFEAQTAADRAADQAAVDAATNPQNIADATVNECARLGLSLADVVKLLADVVKASTKKAA
jgi:hypothetical protein